jgi:hypothetical protein
MRAWCCSFLGLGTARWAKLRVFWLQTKHVTHYNSTSRVLQRVLKSAAEHPVTWKVQGEVLLEEENVWAKPYSSTTAEDRAIYPYRLLSLTRAQVFKKCVGPGAQEGKDTSTLSETEGPRKKASPASQPEDYHLPALQGPWPLKQTVPSSWHFDLESFDFTVVWSGMHQEQNGFGICIWVFSRLAIRGLIFFCYVGW